MNHQEAIVKAVKLLRLATSSNENEAALAAAKAQEIIDRYKLTSLMLEETQQETKEPDEPIDLFDELDFDNVRKGAPRCTWKLRLAQHVSDANQCIVWKTATGIAVCGRPSDVQTVRYMVKLITRQAWELTKKARKGYSDAFMNAYLNGLVAKVGLRLQVMRKELIRELQGDRGSLALVRVDRALVKLEAKRESVVTFMKSKGFRFGCGGRQSQDYNGMSGFDRGWRDGDSIHINKAKGALGAGAVGEIGGGQ